MDSCLRCNGFVPPLARLCPHCSGSITSAASCANRSPWRKVLEAAGGGAIAMTLMACYGAPPRAYQVEPERPGTGDCQGDREDLDGEGWCAQDCDEIDPATHPGATDRPGDGRDQNCDGADGLRADTPAGQPSQTIAR